MELVIKLVIRFVMRDVQDVVADLRKRKRMLTARRTALGSEEATAKHNRPRGPIHNER